MVLCSADALAQLKQNQDRVIQNQLIEYTVVSLERRRKAYLQRKAVRLDSAGRVNRSSLLEVLCSAHGMLSLAEVRHKPPERSSTRLTCLPVEVL